MFTRTTSLMLGLCSIISAASAATLPPVVRGGRTILLRNERPTLTLKLYKRDLNIYDGGDTLKAELYDPTRYLRATLNLPDDGNTAKGAAQDLQSTEVTVKGALKGTYVLQVSGSSDLVFGLETSASGYLVQGELLLNDGSIPGRVYFLPPAEAFTITAQALHPPGQGTVQLLDQQGQRLSTFELAKAGEDVVYKAPAGERAGLWHLDIPHMDVKILLDKPVWWTADSTAWFDAEKTRWMLLPYRQVRTIMPGQQATVTLQLRNRTGRSESFMVEASAPPGLTLTPLAERVELPAGGIGTVELRAVVAAGVKQGERLESTISVSAGSDSAVTTSAAVTVLAAPSLTASTFESIVLKPYEHENVQYGYAPDYVPNEIYFDPQNRPYMRERTESVYGSKGLQVLEGGKWVLRSFLDAIAQAIPGARPGYGAGGFMGAKVAFDGDGGAYTLLQVSYDKTRQNVVIYTPDRGQTWQVLPLGEPGQGAYDVEQFTGHNALNEPPPVLWYQYVKEHPAEFAEYYDLYLYLPKKTDGKLALGEPVKVAENCLGSCQHSGGPASTATRDGKTHIVWGEIAPDDAAGVPTYVATCDQATGKVGERVLLGYAPPVNDVHNVPAIAQDSEGYLHVILGAHGQPFQYVRSLKPNDAYSGWTTPEQVLTAGWVDKDTDADGKGGQTYASLVCGPDDTLHIAYRQWRRNADEHHPDQLYAALSVQSKPKDGPWSAARPVVIPPTPGYSIYYHKLTIDRQGRLYLAYTHWGQHPYQDDYPDRYHNRALVVSRDGGLSWKLVETNEFTQ